MRCHVFIAVQIQPKHKYSPTWKFVNPLELFGFLHKLVMKYYLIFRKVTSIEKYNMLKLIAQNIFLSLMSLLSIPTKHS